MRSRLHDAWKEPVRLVLSVMASAASHDVTTLAAAMSYWLLVTLAPLLAVANAVGAFRTARHPVAEAAMHSVEASVAVMPEDLVGAASAWAGAYAWVVSFLIVLVGATAVFSQFVSALGRIWGQPKQCHPLRLWVRDHALGFLLLLVSFAALVLSAIAGAFASGAFAALEDAAQTIGLTVPQLSALLDTRALLSYLAALVVFTLGFAIVPYQRPGVRAVLPGAAMTAGAYVIGEYALNTYLATTSRFDVLGAFGAFVAFVVWIYYTALIVLYGAELTHELVLRRISRSRAL